VSRARRWAVWLAGALTLGVFGLAWVVYRFGSRARPAPRAGALIVLGARVREDGTASPALAARVTHAVRLFQAGVAPLVIFSGGGNPSEARVGRALAASLPESACLLEESSLNTHDNAAHTTALLRSRGIRDAVLVTDGYHALRARQWFRRHGCEVTVSAAPLEGRGMPRSELCFWLLREAFALAAQPRLLFARKPQIDASATR
jgi:uncharacterized SAM-binding protein YcdF (DUF218 family)